MKKYIIAIVVFVTLLTSCSTNTKCENSISGKLVDMASLDGCTWLIELENGEKLNPLNISEFNLEKTDGLKVSIEYKYIDDIATICMSGKTVKLTRIKTLK